MLVINLYIESALLYDLAGHLHLSYNFLSFSPDVLTSSSIFFSGFATFARLGPQTTITFIVCEKLRELAGMTAM